jgi:hypothetical protein
MVKLFIILLALTACVTRPQVEAELYQNDGIPAAVCDQNPILKGYGVYRVVPCPNLQVHGCENGETGYQEVIPYCSQRIKTMLSADQVRVVEWLNQLTKVHR